MAVLPYLPQWFLHVSRTALPNVLVAAGQQCFGAWKAEQTRHMQATTCGG